MKVSLKRWLCNACVYYTVLSLVLMILQELISGGGEYQILITSYLLLFPCGLCISAAGLLLRAKAIPRWARFLSHYVITVLSLFLFVMLPAIKNLSPASALILLVAVTAVYWIIFAAASLILKLTSNR